MTSKPLAHPDEQLLERYSLGQLSDVETEKIETHLLVCPECQDELAGIEAFVGDMKYACANYRTAPEPERKSIFVRWLDAIPRPAMAGALATVLLLTALPLLRNQPSAVGPLATVELSTVRGAGQHDPVVQAGRPLELKLNLDVLDQTATYRVEMVDQVGRKVWGGSARSAGNTLIANVDRPLSPGAYWVRVLPSQSGPVREYGLSVK